MYKIPTRWMAPAVMNNVQRTLLAILCIACALQVRGQSPVVSDKKVTIRLNDITLEESLTLLGISYGVQFSYSDDIVPTTVKVNLDIREETLETTLEKLLSPYHISYKIINSTRVVLRKERALLTQTIRGTVTDEITGSPVPGATILLADATPVKGTTADEQGRFKLENVPVGRNSLLIRSVGYNPGTVNNILLGTGKEYVATIALQESVTAMQEVVTVGVRNDDVPGDGVALTSGRTFSVEESKRFAGSLGDPARMASAFAGVTGSSDENNALVVKGNSPRGVLWRIEGIEVPNPNHFATEGASSGVVSVLSPNVIEKSDFLTGAFPAQYGNALSAVFDIHLRKGNNERKEYAAQAGLLGIEASAEGPFSGKHNASYLVNYRYSTLSVLDKLGVGLNDAGQYKDYQDLAFNLNFPTTKGAFTVFGIGGKSKSNKTDTTLLDNNRSDAGVLGVTYNYRANANTWLTSSISYSGTQITKFNEVKDLDAGPIALQESYTKSYTRFALSGRRKISNHLTLEAGTIISRLDYNFFLKSVNPGDTVYAVIVNFDESDRNHTMITQGFLYARQYFSPTLFGYYGLHYMQFVLTNDKSLEPRAGLRWQVTPKQSFSIAYGKHSRVENLQYYLARDHQPGGNEVQVNKDLSFTRAHHYVLSYEYAASESRRFKAEVYYQQLYNSPVQADPSSFYSAINEDSGFITDSLINKGDGRNYGVELEYEKTFSHNIYYMINGAVFQSQCSIDGQAEKNTAYNGNYSVHVLGGKEFELADRPGRIGVNFKITYAGGRRYVPIDLNESIIQGKQVLDWERAFAPKLPSYFRTDLQFFYRKNGRRHTSEWRLDIQNVTNHRNGAYYYYDVALNSVRLKKQVGFLPLLSYRIEF